MWENLARRDLVLVSWLNCLARATCRSRAIKVVEPPSPAQSHMNSETEERELALVIVIVKVVTQTNNDKPPNSIIRGGLHPCLICCGELSKKQMSMRFIYGYS